MDAIKLPAVSPPPSDPGSVPVADSVNASQSGPSSAVPEVSPNLTGLAFAAVLVDELLDVAPPVPELEAPPDEPELGQRPADDGNPLPPPIPSGEALATITPPLPADVNRPAFPQPASGPGVSAPVDDSGRPVAVQSSPPTSESEVPSGRPVNPGPGADQRMPPTDTPRPESGPGAVERPQPASRLGGEPAPASAAQFGAQAPEQSTSARTIEAPRISVPVRVETPGWGEALASRITWLAREGVQIAELRLNPPQLGPVEIKISVNNNEAQIAFASHHGAVREALDDAVPRLREMFEQSGIRLGDVNVSARDADRGGDGHGPHDETRTLHPTASGDDDSAAAEGHASAAHHGLIDQYV